MLSVDQALETILSHVKVSGKETSPLLSSIGQVTTLDTCADMDVPDWDSAAMDGFAVRAEDIKGARPHNPRILRVIEAVMAGSISEHRVVSGTAVRIMTGAPVPMGADCVVRFEDTDEELRKEKDKGIPTPEIGILYEEKTGANILKSGGQIAKDSLIIPKGRIIGPGEINVLASLGNTRVKIIRRPLVAIISTGEEQVNPGKTLLNPKLYNGNSFAIAAQVLKCGGIPRILGIARDTRSSLSARIRQGLEADAIITIGGTSKGDRDLVKDVVAKIGKLVFWQIAMAPGEPFTFSLIRKKRPGGKVVNIPHFALPGSPPAAMITFEVLVRPAILKMIGRTDLSATAIKAVMEEPIKNSKAVRRFVWVTIESRNGCYYASQTSLHVKGILSSIVPATGLAIVPETNSHVEKGDRLQVILLDWH